MDQLLASEALYGFAAWLTSRDVPVTLSGHHEAGIAAELVNEFCKANNLPEPRENWTDFLAFPESRSAKSEPIEHPGEVPAGNLCGWALDDLESNVWKSSCGEEWQLETDDPKGNGMNFCPYCGRVIVQMPGPASDTFDEDEEGEL